MRGWVFGVPMCWPVEVMFGSYGNYMLFRGWSFLGRDGLLGEERIVERDLGGINFGLESPS